MAGFRVVAYLCQLLVYLGLMWFGFEQAGMQLPGPVEAPWLWAIAGAAPLVPLHWGGWDGGPAFWGDGLDSGDLGD